MDPKGWEKDTHHAIQYHDKEKQKHERDNLIKHEYHRSREVELRDALKEHQLRHWKQ